MNTTSHCPSGQPSIQFDKLVSLPLQPFPTSEDPSVSNITDIESISSQLDQDVDSPRSVSSLSFPYTTAQQTLPKAKSSQVLNAVVKLNVTHCDPNYGQPWQMKRQGTSTSSGFILPGRKLITNSHSVVHATVIRVQKRTTDRKFSARLIARGDECDLALLTVDDDLFWNDIVPLRLGKQPELNDAVAVAGYPHGGSNISVTAGVVSRVELIPYSNVDSLLGIQIDAAVNPGNSGGPALNMQSEVVGVAFQSMKGIDSENIGYLVPESVLRHFLVDVETKGRYTGFCDFGFKWQSLENDAFRKYLKMGFDDSGVVVRQISPLSDASRALRENDIITKVDGFDVSNAGTVPDICGQRISFHSIVTRKFVGDMLNLHILRDGKPLQVEYKLSDTRSLTLVPVFPADGRPEYVMVGGLVFLALTEPYLQSEYGRKGIQEAPVHLQMAFNSEMKKFQDEEVVVLAQVLHAPFNVEYENSVDERLHKFNGQSVRNVKHLFTMLENSDSEFLRFDLEETVILLDREEAKQAEANIMEIHQIGKASSVQEGSPLKIT